MDHLLQGGEAMVEVTTPIGQSHAITTMLIGTDRQNYLYFSMPDLTAYHRNQFFVEGYRLSINLISERGDGAMIHFDSKIEHIVLKPLQIFTVKLPNQILLHPLRHETRYPVDITAQIMAAKRQLDVQVRDLSIKGCSFSILPLAPQFASDQAVMLRVAHPYRAQHFLLSGLICNQRKMSANTVYGVKFDREGSRHSLELLKCLEFNGSLMVFSQPPATN